MRKFTVFTVILTLVVVVVAAQVVANQYWPNLDLASITGTDSATNPLPNSLNLSANVLGADGQPVNPVETSGLGLDASTLPPTEFGDGLDVPSGASDINGLEVPGLDDSTNQSNSSPQAPISGTADDFESNTYKPAVLSIYLNQDQLKSAGFTNTTIDTEDFDGFLYKTIYLQDLEDLKIFKNVIKSVDSMIAKIYIIDVGPMNSPKTVYDTLKTRGSEGLDIEVNETGEFGDGSFYMNDSRRQNVAFLTVRFGSLIYGFSYPKEYHPQVKNLVKLLDMEF
ncbi:hypothetical protein COY05_05150 [Candidatus Peregrinibacteria bacterium CG_4_10_14_0_2_um_filter_38_24]|nr:MAG: hypothetical protein COY05_05150 [Candidatus Peregrinibacteria bacterium CG_4_10_14_0_2_um_filter_38_24]PJC38948.1 MAG: hypothetical protein CO044_02320 [Candidatus Peregrinibacteria bacterium CG_4_9_14_0_2_um_filter_38_9]